MGWLDLSPAVRGYLERHAVDPDLAYQLGVRSDRDTILYPVTRPRGGTYWRERDLNDPRGRTKQPKGEPLVVWWPAGRPEPGAEVALCEGEPDGLAAFTALNGAPYAVAAIPGTSIPVERVTADLASARVVYLALDDDEAGREAADRIARALQVHTELRIVRLGDGEDLASRLYRESENDRGRWLRAVLASAEPVPKLRPKRETDRYRRSSRSPAPVGSTLTDFTEIVAKPVRWIWRDRVAERKLIALSGRPKIGKGLLYSGVIGGVTTGRLDGDLDGPRNAIIATTEDDPGDTLKPRLIAAEADLARVSFFQMGTRDEPVPFRIPEHAEELGRRIAEKRAPLVVIDPLVEFIDGKLDTHKSQQTRQALASLNAIARDRGCAMVVIIHLNKGASTDPLLRQEASAAFTQVVRGGLLLGHDPDDPDGDTGDQRVLAVSASNLAPIASSLVYRIEPQRVVGDTGEPIDTARIVPIGTSAADGHDLLRGQEDADDRADREEAVGFLVAELKDGPSAAGDVQAAARKAGIGPWPLKRAKRTLGVRSSKSGMTGGWTWTLPDDEIGPSSEGDAPKGMRPESENPSPSSPSANQAVFEGSEGDEIPEGDAARNRIPFGESQAAAERIREEMRNAPCSCERVGELAADGRCSRCWGWPNGLCRVAGCERPAVGLDGFCQRCSEERERKGRSGPRQLPLSPAHDDEEAR